MKTNQKTIIEKMSDEELKEYLHEKKITLEITEYVIAQAENEIFYREKPECRPKMK